MPLPFVEENTASRRKLVTLVSHLSDEELALVTPYGWTVAALLAHMAWWDQRVLVLLRRWKEQGVDESPVDSQLINDALKPLCHALEPRAAVQLCLASATETDAEVAATSPELIAQIEAGPTHFRFNRALHRNDHIRDIEALIGQRIDLQEQK
ncbi:MAG: maleylpyruvate isomerase N-terminal domain-containing protein [Caldilineaceae bacterium]